MRAKSFVQQKYKTFLNIIRYKTKKALRRELFKNKEKKITACIQQ